MWRRLGTAFITFVVVLGGLQLAALSWSDSPLSQSAPVVRAAPPDPGVQGPLAVSTDEYNFGASAYTPPGFPSPVEVTAAVYSPTDLSGGPYPLIVLLVNAIGAVDGYATNIVAVPTSIATARTTNPVKVTATRQDPSLSTQLALQLVDGVGNVTACDPVVVDLGSTPGKPVTQVYTGVVQNERYLQVANGNPGVQTVVLHVNGSRYQVRAFADGEVRTIDIGSLVRPGSNIVEVELHGKPYGSVSLYIGDLLPPGAAPQQP